MPSGDRIWLSTGEAARLCSVERDTVLKWIKRGRIPAVRTPGGHYRIARQDLERLRAASPARHRPAGQPDAGWRCWEFMAAGGPMRSECRDCLAYRTRASFCFGLREQPGLAAGILCWDWLACRDCPYYRRLQGLPTRVLLVSADESWSSSFKAGAPKLELRVARNARQAASQIPDWWPALVVIDAETLGGGEVELLQRLLADQPVVGLRVLYVYVTDSGAPRAALDSRTGPVPVIGVLRKPFGPEEILRVLEGIWVGAGSDQGTTVEAKE